ncbi:hypothetical protein DRN69_04820 [Candidatus Pacearchaeota archaeon]|nr:MAG: hypothetical protein DRN69_04820 [Candidatus Pacearchaeota archaeon]
MSKENQKIIVVERDLLFGDNYFQGFRPYCEVDYESRILQNLKIMRRGDAEHNPLYKQPIGYTLIIDPNLKGVFAYQRSSKIKEYGEKRLQGKWSWGIGGHIEPIDNISKNPIRESILREVIKEEVEIIGTILEEPRVLGYINDDSNSVGSVHFGVLYTLEINGDVKPKDPEIARGSLRTLNHLEFICNSSLYDVEEWSKIALKPLRKLL